ncbi:MAG: mannose-1-phosphate guanylyltransferase [Verrucomicrobia bacterium]|nr:mannose-1-phosphate guanylyltransferase [Verrucomicrobiota bacterium]
MKQKELSSTFALILAGGSGTRFWPLSRELRPKQLLSLFGEGQTMLEQTVHRLDGLIAPEKILILTNCEQEEGVRAVLGGLVPAENIISEPEKRDTAPAIALAVGWVSARDPEATLVVLPSDQRIRDHEGFHLTIRQAVEVSCREQGIVTIGIKPTWPCTAYGYLQNGEQVAAAEGEDELTNSVCYVESFREKPNAKLAKEFLEQGNFSWNAGIFVWQVSTVVRELERHCPELADFVEKLQNSENFSQTVDDEFSKLPKLSIDYALMEKAACVLSIAASFDWDDLGGWLSAAKYLETDAQGNACNTRLTSVDSNNNVVYADDEVHVALLGVNDFVVVQTSDAILVASRDAMDGMKTLVDEVPDEVK